jgi:mevalonate kinase
MTAFKTVTYSKWILVGEHAVLRGCPALVFPYLGRTMRLEFTPGGQGLNCNFQGPDSENLPLLFWGVIEKALSLVGRGRESVTGKFELYSNVPVGAGLGASATLCAAVSRWLEWQGWITSDRVYDVARELENLFHGESSGVDIAVALSGEPLEFRRGMKPQPIRPRWEPRLYISYSGVRGLTSECVKKVQQLFIDDSSKARQFDARMVSAVERAKKALLNSEDAMQRLQLCQALNEAGSCFDGWDLTRGELGAHIKLLRDNGALACKPTGSGQGGYVLSMWDREPQIAGVELDRLSMGVGTNSSPSHDRRPGVDASL